MRTYGRRLLRGATDRASKQVIESRDAVLWDVLLTERVCRCKIQGSNEYVIAKFPQNWATVPEWCKPGQAVRIAHRGGVRGYVELVGFGRAIPTPVSGTSIPTGGVPADALLAGCQIRAMPQTPCMSVYVSTGAARISGVIDTVPALGMSAGSAFVMGMGLAMGEAAGVFDISAATAGHFRCDLFSLSSLLAVIKTEGSEFTATESRPILPAGNLLIGDLLVRGGQTLITGTDIALRWSTPVPASITAGCTDNGAAWSIVASVKDQYGNPITTAYGWNIAATLASGDGSLSPASGNTGTGNSVTFTYTEGTAGTFVAVELVLSRGEQSAYGTATFQL